jgi:hypothetical protein
MWNDISIKGNTKEFCSGWKSATQFTLQQLLTARRDNNTPTANNTTATWKSLDGLMTNQMVSKRQG